MPEQLEDRVANLDAEVSQLKQQLDTDPSTKPWWDQIIGKFADNSASLR